ncbi:MAG: exo-alpha-sialidase [Actinomycetota bacterium]|nr:exo-alpha-sialidase [Actinomycetota bacterium]
MSAFFRGLGILSGPRRATTRGLFAVLVFSLIFVVAAACSTDQPAGTSSDDTSLAHVHALVTNPADGSLLAATHQGVYKVENERATLVGDGRQDTMGLTVLGPDRLYASGHPEDGTGSSPHLGLIASEDGAKTWTTLSQEGKADFHSLVPTEVGVYGFNSLKSTLMFSDDGKSWVDLFTADLYDVAADPSDPDHLLLATAQGLQEYRRGSDPVTVNDTSDVVFVEWVGKRTVVGLTPDGSVLTSTDDGRNWSPAGRVSGAIEALGATAEGWQVATSSGIYESTDQGKTWRRILTRR